MEKLLFLILIYIFGFLYYEKEYKIMVYDARYNLYYIKRITLYNFIENSSYLKLNCRGVKNCIIEIVSIILWKN